MDPLGALLPPKSIMPSIGRFVGFQYFIIQNSVFTLHSRKVQCIVTQNRMYPNEVYWFILLHYFTSTILCFAIAELLG